MKAVVIGGAGFVAHYMLEALKAAGNIEVHATLLQGEEITVDGVVTHVLDVRDGDAFFSLLNEVKPDRIFHLAAISSVALSWSNPRLTVDVNIIGALNLLEAMRKAGGGARALLIGSGEEYGFSGRENCVLDESITPRPGNIYAVTKCAQNQLATVYAKAYDLPVVLVRAFNHIGAGQSPQFVTADFCRQVARMEAGLDEPVLRVGNLDAARDFCDVRDIVAAYMQLLEVGQPGETYNVGSGNALPIRDVIKEILSLSSISIDVQTDPKKLRPLDMPSIRADITKIQAVCGWKPRYSLHESLQDVLNDWRLRVSKEEEWL